MLEFGRLDKLLYLEISFVCYLVELTDVQSDYGGCKSFPPDTIYVVVDI